MQLWGPDFGTSVRVCFSGRPCAGLPPMDLFKADLRSSSSWCLISSFEGEGLLVQLRLRSMVWNGQSYHDPLKRRPR